jgi:NAD(P)-dependent dehydrogenase (short-subunit alcohol dehydrogenase family)
MPDFSDQVVVISGASGNLGVAAAHGFATAGAKLGLLGRNLERLKSALGELATSSQHMLLAPVDMTEADSVKHAIDKLAGHFGRLDVLLNLTGGYRAGTPVHESDPEDWDFMLSLNARTAYLGSRAVVPHMLRRGRGNIVNIGGRPGLKGVARTAAYSASKSAVIRLTESMASELKTQGVNVNCVLPGTMDTPDNRKAMPNAKHERWVPLEEVVKVIMFLTSDAARAVHGASIPVDGLS